MLDDYRYILESTIGIPFSQGNRVRVLKNGIEIFPAMLDAIEEAKHQIDFLTFIYWKGDIAHKFADTLSRKAEEGVEIRLILDSFGAAVMPRELVRQMESSGVQIEWFRPIPQWKVWKTDNRTHRKILICDRKVAFTGGVGIAEEWEGDARNPDEWRETHFRVIGPAVQGLESAFLENWIEAGHDLKHKLRDVSRTRYSTHDETDIDDISLQVIRTAASVKWSDIVMLYQSLVQMAQNQIRITTAYFNPNEIMLNLLTEAVERGVEIEIMIPGEHTDKRVANIAGGKSFDPLLDAGVDIWFYQKTMLHAKIITVDGVLSCIGSANFNHRSMLKDDEVNIVALSEKLTSTLMGQFEDDLKNCEKVKKQRWKRRSLVQKGFENVTSLFTNEI